LELEKESSSFSRKLLLLPALAYSLLVFLFSFSKDSTPAHSTRQENKPDNDRNRSQNVSGEPIRVIVDSLPPKPSPTEEESAEKRKKKRWKIAKAFLEVLALIGLWVYVCETTRTNNLTQQALIDGERHFNQSQRPWVGLEDNNIIVAQPSFFWGVPPRTVEFPSITITASYSLKNFGNGPALHENDIVVAIPSTGETIPPTQEMEPWCRMPEIKGSNPGPANPGAGEILLPGARIPKGMQTNLLASSAQLLQTGRIWIFVCVAYQSDSDTRVHHSRYWYLTVNGEVPITPSPEHPKSTYLPIKGAYLMGASAD
jgi:hypothetical protein